MLQVEEEVTLVGEEGLHPEGVVLIQALEVEEEVVVDHHPNGGVVLEAVV
jgi:hypothetical protein